MIGEGAFLDKALSELIRGGFAFIRRKAAKKILAEALLREIRFNIAMVYEAEKVSSEGALGFDAPIFLRKMKVSAIESIFSTGYPLSELFKGGWAAPEASSVYSPYLRNCNTKADLLEKMFHRVMVLNTMAQENILPDGIKFDYAMFILKESESIVREYVFA